MTFAKTADGHPFALHDVLEQWAKTGSRPQWHCVSAASTVSLISCNALSNMASISR